MTVSLWPADGAPERLGEKAQGLIDLAAMGLAVPVSLVLREEALLAPGVDLEARCRAIVEECLLFFGARDAPRRAVSLRCAAKGRAGGARIFPESVLALGMADAPADPGAREAVCAAHAEAFFAFFGGPMPEDFPAWPLDQQLETLVWPLMPHLARLAASEEARPCTVIVQEMVYGDLDARSLTGVCYTRHPRTGELVDYGHILVGRQGMALGGVDDSAQQDLSLMASLNPPAYAVLKAALPSIEARYSAVRQLEFTAEGDRLFFLQNTAGNATYKLE